VVNASAERETRNRGGGGAERMRGGEGRTHGAGADAGRFTTKVLPSFCLHFIPFRSRDKSKANMLSLVKHAQYLRFKITNPRHQRPIRQPRERRLYCLSAIQRTLGAFVRAAHGLGCARGLQLAVFVALARSLARLARAKRVLSARPRGNTRNPRFPAAELVAARAGDFGRRRSGSRGLWREGETSFARDGARAGG
jgi:hypothetical protein